MIVKTRECGSCSMCCKILPIEEGINKPANEWCKHWTKKTRCSIYSSRPEVCKGFECVWLQDTLLPDEIRPDKSKVVLKYHNERLIAVVDRDHPNAWREGLLGKLLEKYDDGYSIYIGKQKIADVAPKE
jgi:Fe-S-cluster containining protein